MFSVNSHRLLLGFLLLVHIALATGYAMVVPPLNWPDEPAHLNYVLGLQRGLGLQVMSEAVWAEEDLAVLIDEHFQSVEDPLNDPRISAIQYQAHQPPLFYGLAALVVDLVPSEDGPGGVLAVRFLNLAFSVGTLLLVGSFLRRVGAGPTHALMAVGFLALLPTRTYFAVSISNDVVIEFWFALFFWLLASTAQDSKSECAPTGSVGRFRSAKRLLSRAGLGVVMGLALLTKATAILLVVLQALWTRGQPSAVRRLLATVGVGVLLAAPWLVRNVTLYGFLDPLALRAGAWGFSDALAQPGVGRPTLELLGAFGLWPFFKTLFLSFWGVFGWMEMVPGLHLQWLYVLLTLMAMVGVTRLMRGRRVEGGRSLDQQRGQLRVTVQWCVLALLTGIGAVIAYSCADYQPQGRYLLPLSAPIAVLFALGCESLVPLRGKWVATVALTALGLANLYSILYVIPWYLAGGVMPP